MSTLDDLLKQSSALEGEIGRLKKSARAEAIARIHVLMAEHDLSATDVAKAATRQSNRGETTRKVAPKYRDPDSGATWSGRGLKPRWLTQALAAGKAIGDFAL